jgi:uncharacterized membrane protein
MTPPGRSWSWAIVQRPAFLKSQTVPERVRVCRQDLGRTICRGLEFPCGGGHYSTGSSIHFDNLIVLAIIVVIAPFASTNLQLEVEVTGCSITTFRHESCANKERKVAAVCNRVRLGSR